MVAILVILMVAAALGIDLAVRAWRKRRGIVLSPRQQIIPLPEWARLPLEKLSFPAGLFYGRGHTWARVRDDGDVQIGIDDFLNAAVGPVQLVKMLKEGTRVQRGEPLAQLKQDGITVWVRSPIGGTVRRSNQGVDPSQLRNDPYGSGWLAEVHPDNPGADLHRLRIGAQVREWIEREALRFGRFLAEPSPNFAMATLQDGGQPVEKRLAALGPDRAQAFATEFLNDSEEALR